MSDQTSSDPSGFIVKTDKDLKNKKSIRISPKTDSEDESDTLVIRPQASHHKKKLAFSLTKQASAPLKHIKLKKLTKDKPVILPFKVISKVDPIRATVDSIEAEKRRSFLSTSLPKTPAVSDTIAKKKEKSPKKSEEDQTAIKKKESRHRSPVESAPKGSSGSQRNKRKQKSETPKRESTRVSETKASVKNTELKADKESRRSRRRSEKEQEDIPPKDVVANRLKEIEATIDILKTNKKPRFSLLALPREGSSKKPLISYSQKIVHFTSTPPTVTWAPNPSIVDEPYYMSRDFYLAHASADQQTLFRAIAESKHIKFEGGSTPTEIRSWYPKDDYLLSKEKKMPGTVSSQSKKKKSKSREKRISLVDYDSADDKSVALKGESEGKSDGKKTKNASDSSALRIEGTTVKVKSKWDSDYEESVSDQEKSCEPMDVEVSKEKPIETPEEVVIPTPVTLSQPPEKKEEPKQLVSEYEEFLKLVGTESPNAKQSAEPDDVQIAAAAIPSIPPVPPKTDWDNDSSSDSLKKSSAASYKVVGKKASSSPVKPKQRKKKRDKKKKKAVSNSDSSSESSDSSHSSSAGGKKKKSKRKKKKRTKKVKVVSESSSSESEEDEKVKKVKTKKKSKDPSEKVLLELQMQKEVIAQKLSELDALSDKKSKKAIAKDLKTLEEQISNPRKSEGEVSKKGKKSKKSKKKKKKISSSSDDDSDVPTKNKKTKKTKNKKKIKKKKSSSDSSSEDEMKVAKKKKKKKELEKKEVKTKKKKEQKDELLEDIPKTEEKQIWRKRPAEEDISPVLRSRPKLEEVDNSGWEDEDSKAKAPPQIPECIKKPEPVQSEEILGNSKTNSIANSCSQVLSESINEKPGMKNNDWEANSEADNEWKMNSPKVLQKPVTEVRAFEAVGNKSSAPVLKIAEPALDLYSPGASDSELSEIVSPAVSTAEPVQLEDSNVPSPESAVLEDSNIATVAPVVLEDSTSLFFPLEKEGHVLLPPPSSMQHSELSVSSSCIASQDDVYDPLTMDSDASNDIYVVAPAPVPVPVLVLPIGLDEIPLPAFPSIADILLPGENPTRRPTNALKTAKKEEKSSLPLKVPVKTEPSFSISDKVLTKNTVIKAIDDGNKTPPVPEKEKPQKANRWDRVSKADGKEEVSPVKNNSPSLETIPLLIPKLSPISLSKLPLPKVAEMPVPSVTPSTVQLNQTQHTHFITVKTQQKLQLKVASVFQSDSDEEFANTNSEHLKELKAKALQKDIHTKYPVSPSPVSTVDETDFPARKDKREDTKWEEEEEKQITGESVEKKPISSNDEKGTVEREKHSEKDRESKSDRDRTDSKSDRSRKDGGRRRSISPRKRVNRRSPDRNRKRTRSPDRRYRKRSRSLEKRRRRSPSPRRRPRSPSPKKRRSPSPKKRRTPSPKKRRSPSPKKRRSLSPKKRRSTTPKKRLSPIPKKRRSPSPKNWRRPLSPRHQRSRTRSRSRTYSPRGSRPQRRSRSPVRRPPSPASRSPIRRRTRSPSPHPSHRSSLIPVYGHAAPLQVNPPLPSTPFPEPEEKMTYSMSVDHRIIHEFGVKLERTPPPLPALMPVPAPVPQDHLPPFYYPSPSPYHVVPIPPYSAAQGGIVQVGNIMEVVPGIHAPPPPPPPPPPPKQQILQVGNMLQIVPTTRATAVVAPTPMACEPPLPPPTIDTAVLQNPLIKAIQAEREKMKKEKEARRAERESRRRTRQAKREAKLMTVSEKLKKVERNEGLVLGQEVDEEEELLLEAMEPPSPPSPVEVVIVGDIVGPPAGKSILITPTFNKTEELGKKKEVTFADGLKPGDASESEEKAEVTPKALPKEKRFKKKIKKKVKVRIIRQVIQSDEEEDDLPPPSPPPGDPPPVLYATFPFGGQVQYPVYQTSVTTTTTKTTLHISAPLPQ